MNEKGRRIGCAALDLDLSRPLRAGVPLAVVAEIRSRRRIVFIARKPCIGCFREQVPWQTNTKTNTFIDVGAAARPAPIRYSGEVQHASNGGAKHRTSAEGDPHP
jgi:hypothetical protein